MLQHSVTLGVSGCCNVSPLQLCSTVVAAVPAPCLPAQPLLLLPGLLWDPHPCSASAAAASASAAASATVAATCPVSVAVAAALAAVASPSRPA